MCCYRSANKGLKNTLLFSYYYIKPLHTERFPVTVTLRVGNSTLLTVLVPEASVTPSWLRAGPRISEYDGWHKNGLIICNITKEALRICTVSQVSYAG